MAIIRRDEADSLPVLDLRRGDVARSEARPLGLPRIGADGTRQPEAPVAPAEPPPPPPAPVFEVPGEILQSVYEQAVQQGLEDGKNQVFAELTVLQSRYAAAIEQLLAVSRELAAFNQVQLVDLSCRVAEEVLREELKVNPRKLQAMVAEALAKEQPGAEVTVHCSPGDHEFLSEARAELAEGTGDTFQVRVLVDAELEYGDFRLETNVGETDGRLKHRLAGVREVMKAGGLDEG